MTKMPALPIYEKKKEKQNKKKKTFKNLLWNQKANDLVTLYAALGTRVLPSMFKWYPWVDLDLKSDLVPYAFVWEKVETINFSGTIVVYDIKIGRWSQLNEYMNIYEYQRSWSFIDLGPSHSDSIFSNFFSSLTAMPTEAKLHMEPPWDGGTKVYSVGPGHLTKIGAMPYMVKT